MEKTVANKFLSSFRVNNPFMKKEKSALEVEREELLMRLDETKRELEAVRSEYENQTDFEIIDVYISQLDALETRYSYLFKEAKRLLSR